MGSLRLLGLFFLGFLLAVVFGPALLNAPTSIKKITPRYGLQYPVNQKEQLLNNIKAELRANDNPKTSFVYLRSENLSAHPELQIAINPELRSEAIEKLISKFGDVDWLMWKENLSSVSESKSDARRWLDKIKVVNFDLGRYLETSALLLSALYQATNLGKVFSAEEELYELSTEASLLFKLVTPKAYSPRTNLDVSITSDASFHVWLEQLRAQFVVNYGKKEPKQIETQLHLLASVKPEFLTSPVIAAYVKLMQAATKEISPKYRLELKESYFRNGRERELLELSNDFTNAFEVFYVRCVRDAIESNSLPSAKALLLQYGEYLPNGKYIAELQTEISTLENAHKETMQVENNILTDKGNVNTKSKIGFSEYLSGISGQDSVQDLVEKVGFWIISVLLLGLVVVKSLPFFLLLIRRERIRRERKYAALAEEKAKLASEEKDNIGNMVSITTPLNSKGRPYSKAREKKLANS